MSAHILSAICTWLIGALTFFFFFTPGFSLSLRMRRLGKIDEDDLLVVAVLMGAGLGYLVFWAYFLDYRFGRVVTAALMLVSLLRAKPVWTTLFRIKKAETWKIPLTVCFATYLFYNGLCLSPLPNDSGLYAGVETVTGSVLPGDNRLPLVVSHRMFFNEDPRDLGGDWHSSDHPPLQAGIFLAQYPLSYLFGEDRFYQCLSVFLQALWIIAVFALCRAWGFSASVTSRTLLFCLFSGFFFINSVFVWPKLLSGALFILGLQFLWFKPDRPVYYWLGGLGTTLAFLSHGGVAFSLIPIPLCFFLFKKITPSLLFRTAVLFTLLAAPWMLYQKLYDPPGNRLLKWHLADSPAVDSRSTGQAIRDAYSRTPFKQLVTNRLENLLMLFPPLPSERPELTRVYWGIWRARDFIFIFGDLGILSIGFLLFFFFKPPPSFPARAVLTYWVLGTIIWCGLLFSPRATAIYCGSYGYPILIYCWLGFFVASIPSRYADGLLGARIAYFLMAYLFYSKRAIGFSGYSQLFLVSFAGLAILGNSLKQWAGGEPRPVRELLQRGAVLQG